MKVGFKPQGCQRGMLVGPKSWYAKTPGANQDFWCRYSVQSTLDAAYELMISNLHLGRLPVVRDYPSIKPFVQTPNCTPRQQRPSRCKNQHGRTERQRAKQLCRDLCRRRRYSSSRAREAEASCSFHLAHGSLETLLRHVWARLEGRP